MKLVQLLAKELKEWPESAKYITQEDDDGSVTLWYRAKPKYKSGEWVLDRHLNDSDYAYILHGIDTASDNKTSIVNQDQWQAEREKMNKPKWIRHRGMKQPVNDGVTVEVKLRSGSVQTSKSENFMWSYGFCDSSANIMQYRVIEETKDQEIEEVKDTNIGTLSITLDVNDVFKPMIASMKDIALEWGQIVSPLKWRDAIIHCQAIIEDCEREIERNVSLLDAEGLMMQKDSKKAMQHYAPDVDMSDWRNWQAGDVIEIVANEGGHQF